MQVHVSLMITYIVCIFHITIAVTVTENSFKARLLLFGVCIYFVLTTNDTLIFYQLQQQRHFSADVVQRLLSVRCQRHGS